ncbi:Lrp/AsnC ligand binding domain-containing protein [Streptomyces sp. NPDC056708]|uniref:Lrp/AsnC ligand binding domain-containing protein n=1 Tax=unclassified Streptomyces TaxID=2593676 RepID=UPI00369B0826
MLTTGQALAGHPEAAYVGATTGPTDLHAVLMSHNVQDLFTYLTTRVAALPGVRQAETAPIRRTLKGPGPFPCCPPRSLQHRADQAALEDAVPGRTGHRRVGRLAQPPSAVR